MQNRTIHNSSNAGEQTPYRGDSSSMGVQDIFAQLIREHREAAGFIERILETKDSVQLEDLWSVLRTLLLSHERAERQEVYAPFQTYSTLLTTVRSHNTQADNLESLIEELDRLPIESTDWKVTFRLLAANVKEHVEFEEREFFPRARAAIGERLTAMLEKPYLVAKEEFAHEREFS